MDSVNKKNTFQNNLTVLYETFKEKYPTESWQKYGFYTDEYLKVINRHWLEFGPAPTQNYYILAVVYCILMIIGLSGNFTVIFLYIRCKSLQTSANMLILNLAISDGLMILKTPIFIYNSILLGPALGGFFCQLYGFIGGLTGTVSICSLAAISLDRFYVIKYPLKRNFSKLRVKLSILATWIYGMVFASIPLLNIGCGTYVPEGYLTSCSFDYLTTTKKIQIFIWCYFTAAWVIPISTITYSYLNILNVVITQRKASAKSHTATESHRHVKEEEVRRQEMKLSLLVLLTVSLWFISWTPYAIVALLGITKNKNLITPFGSMIPAVFCKTASCIDPFIYAISHPKFKEELHTTCFGNIMQKTRKMSRAFSFKSSAISTEFDDNELSCVSEVVEIDIGSIVAPSTEQKFSHEEKSTESPIKKVLKPGSDEKSSFTSVSLPFYAKLLRPNFKNRSSSVRRLAHRVTIKHRRKTLPADRKYRFQ